MRPENKWCRDGPWLTSRGPRTMLAALFISLFVQPRTSFARPVQPRQSVCSLCVTRGQTWSDPDPGGDNVAPAEDELKRLGGTWSLRTVEVRGAVFDAGCLRPAQGEAAHPLVEPRFQGDKLALPRRSGQPAAAFCSVSVDPLASPKVIDLVRPEGTLEGIYEVSGDALKMCINVGALPGERPRSFGTPQSANLLLLVYTRCAAGAPGGIARLPRGRNRGLTM